MSKILGREPILTTQDLERFDMVVYENDDGRFLVLKYKLTSKGAEKREPIIRLAITEDMLEALLEKTRLADAQPIRTMTIEREDM